MFIQTNNNNKSDITFTKQNDNSKCKIQTTVLFFLGHMKIILCFLFPTYPIKKPPTQHILWTFSALCREDGVIFLLNSIIKYFCKINNLPTYPLGENW